MSLLRKWGFGAELVFEGGRATANMGRAQKAVVALRGSFRSMQSAGSSFGTMLRNLGALAVPIGAGFGLLAAKSSGLAANLEAQKLTMRTLIGDYEKADRLLAMIRENAAATPFQEGDLIEGSKRLLRLTGDNIDENIDLLKVMETMAALNPGKSVVDAVEGVLDATSGGGFERLKEFGLSFRAEDFKQLGRPGGKAWADGVTEAIKQRMVELTRGEDLVGALADTFSGRASTFRDAIENMLKPIGEVINSTVGPVLVRLTDLIKASTDDIAAGAELGLARIFSAWQRWGQPVADLMLKWWEGLGGDGRRNVVAFLTVLGALASAAIPIGGALVAGGLALGALGAGASAVVSIVAALWSGFAAVSAMIGGPLAAAAALGLGLFAAIGVGMALLARRSNNLANIMPLALGDALEGGTAALANFRVAAVATWRSFMASMAPAISMILDGLQPAFDGMIDLVIDLAREFGIAGGTTGDWSAAGEVLGKVLTGVVLPALILVGAGVGLLIDGVSFLLPALTGTVTLFRRLAVALFGMSDGTLSASEGFHLMGASILQTIGAMVRGLVALLLGSLTSYLRQISTIASAIPGYRSTPLARLGDLSGDLASQVDRQIEEAISEVDRQAHALERIRAARTFSPTVNVEQAPVEVTANVETTVCVDDTEIARAGGSAAVRSGERGTGAPLPAQQRGRVLRHGLQVTALNPTEAF